jgi:5-methylcytosine-specific restriction endonuclease McrA
MSSPIFVRDAQGTPLMPMAAAYARRLLRHGKAQWVPHHAFPVIQLSQTIAEPVLRPIILGLQIHLHTAELHLLATGVHQDYPLLHAVIDLRTDISIRIRRRAGHRRRRRAQGRYRPARTYGVPFKLRRPSMARSRWGRLIRRRVSPMHRRHNIQIPTMRWRAQAIGRVITALQALLPISQVIVLSPGQQPSPFRSHSAAELRQQLIACYGQLTPAGDRIAMCAYCGTTAGRIEVDHLLPQSRSGTDGWSNRVLACATCNARKGNRTPEEAGMALRIPPQAVSTRPNRAGVYPQQTAQLLVHDLLQCGMSVSWPADVNDMPADVSTSLAAMIAALKTWPASMRIVVARPIARPVKQVYSARNYPLSTPRRAGFVRVGTTIKRRIRVNQALAITRHPQRRIEVMPINTPMPSDSRQIIRLGMLCEGIRCEQTVTGVVAAIHSSGRLTLLTPESVRDRTVVWHRSVISPRQHLRVVSTDRVIFLPVAHDAANTQCMGDETEGAFS